MPLETRIETNYQRRFDAASRNEDSTARTTALPVTGMDCR